jgi:radical SAM superfamily enzyme YgiQ (UPF0313 family)
MVPLDLATIASLTPDEVNLVLWDEAVKGPADSEVSASYDFVGITGYDIHYDRALQLAGLCREAGKPVAVGGPGASAAPERYRAAFDILFIGEAEHTWPRFLLDYRNGEWRSEYRQVGNISMEASPAPRWELLRDTLDSYFCGAVQTTRGCPFDCEFCDVIYLYGRKARHKSVDQVVEEVSSLAQLGLRHIFFCDDNFIGNPSYAKRLLRRLIEFQERQPHSLGFFTQLTLNVAQDEELLRLLADANFYSVFIGIESPNVDSLVETNKPQNFRADMIAAIRKVHSYGIPIRAGMIVGFDHDDARIFDQHVDFLLAAGIPSPSMNLLKAPTGTKLWVRLQKERRVVKLGKNTSADPGAITNIVPRRMSRIELFAGFRDLMGKVSDWSAFETRTLAMIASVTYCPPNRAHLLSIGQVWQFLRFLLFRMPSAARKVTIRLIITAVRKRKNLLDKVIAQIMIQYMEWIRLPAIQAVLESQIQEESTHEGTPRLESQPPFVSAELESVLDSLIEELYQHVSENLRDKSRTVNILVEATADFAARWGDEVPRFSSLHKNYLLELCDRATAKENTRNEDGPTSNDSAKVPRTSADRRRLTRDILRSVEQELRSPGALA